MTTAGAPERVAKRIARSGLCSRRDAERLIAAARVAVDGLVLTSPAVTVTEANVITVPTQTGVTYKRTDTGATLSPASTVTLDAETLKTVKIEASPTTGYYFDTDADIHDSWTYKYKA